MPPNKDTPTPNSGGQPQDNPPGLPSTTPNAPSSPDPAAPSYPASNIIQPTNSSSGPENVPAPPTTPVTEAYGASTPVSQTAQPNSAPQSPSPYAIPTQGGTVATQPIPSGESGGRNKKKLITLGAVSAAVLLLAGGAVFGWYLPNQPQNVYNTGLNRTGEVVDKLLVEATQEEKLKSAENSDFTGTLEFNGPDGNYKGTFNSKYDANQSDSTLKYEQPGEGGQKAIDVRFLTDLAENKEYPDLFFQINGLKSMGLEEFVPGIGEYDGKWISVSSEYLKSLVPADTKEEQQKIEFTQKDAADLAAIFSSTTREYVFTTNPDKAVLTQKSFVGTEKLDGGMTANHYTMALNKSNVKKYCKALTEAFMSADAYKRIPGVNPDTLEADKKTAFEDCDSSDEIDENETFDMWIDKRNKLIHKIRVTDKEQKGSYFEVGQNYTKGDVIPMFAIYHSDEDKTDGKLTLEYNSKQSTTRGTLAFDMTDGGAGSFDDTTGDVIRDTATETEKYSVKGNFEFKPHTGDITIEKPANATPIEKVFEKFGVDPAALSGSGNEGDFSTQEDF